MLMTPPSSLVVASVAEDWIATMRVIISGCVRGGKTLRLTSSAQRHHASLPKTKDDNISRRIAALIEECLLDQDLKQHRTLLQPRIGIKPTRRRVENDIVAPMRALQIKQSFRSTNRHARRLRQIHLPAERGESILPVAQAMQQDQHVGRRVILGRCSRALPSAFETLIAIIAIVWSPCGQR